MLVLKLYCGSPLACRSSSKSSKGSAQQPRLCAYADYVHVTLHGQLCCTSLTALIVLGCADYAGGSARLEGTNYASGPSCADCVLVLSTLIAHIAVAMLVVVIALRVLIVLRY